MHSDTFYMKQAYKQANKALEFDEVPVGAIIVKDNKIIARAFNKKETIKSPIAHAEILAISKACKKLNSWHLDGCTIYVTLEPCMMCAGAILQSRIERVVYGAINYQDGAIETTLSLYDIKGYNHYPKTYFYKDMNECGKIISNYFKTKR